MRVLLKALLIALILILLYVALLLNCVTPRLSRHKRRASILTLSCRMLCRALSLKINVSGQPPQPPFILVSNHLSYVDIILLTSQLKGTFISKAEVRRWPFFGSLCILAGTIFIDRNKRSEIPRVNRLIKAAYESGNGIVFFPEGTSTDGTAVGRFRPALLESAAKNGYPVYYADIHYKTPQGYPPAHQSVCWWGDMEFIPHFKALLRIPRVQAGIRFGKNPVIMKHRDALAEELHRCVVERFVPTRTLETF